MNLIQPLARPALRFFLALVAALSLHSAVQAAATVSGPASARVGDSFTLSFNESVLSDFAFAEFLVIFDPTVLTLVSANTTALTADFQALAGATQPEAGGLVSSLVSLITGLAGIATGSGDIVELVFTVNASAAAGPELLSFAVSDADVYAFRPFEFMLNILPAANTLPLAPTSVLLLPALLALAWVRRRAR